MHRRRFLKLLGLASAWSALRFPIPWAAVSAASKSVSAGGRLYRSDGTGRVYVSTDGGLTWRLHSDLGSGYSVTRLTVDRGDRLHANVGFQAWSFNLVLAPNRQSWLTT